MWKRATKAPTSINETTAKAGYLDQRVGGCKGYDYPALFSGVFTNTPVVGYQAQLGYLGTRVYGLFVRRECSNLDLPQRTE